MLNLFSIALSGVLATSTAIIPTIPTLQPSAPRTSGIVAASDGTVYFVDSFRDIVWRVRPGGVPTPFVTGRNGLSLQIGGDGRLYGLHRTDAGSLTVWRADDSGVVSDVARPNVPRNYGDAFVLGDGDSIIGSTGTGRRSGVRLWRAGRHGFDLIAGGRWGMRDGAASDARFFPIGGMTRAPDGALLVTSGATVRRVEANGSVSTLVADERLLEPKHSFLSRLLGDVQGHLTGIATDADGAIYVANAARGTVVRIGADGAAIILARSSGGWSPTGVAVNAGVLYVLEYGPGVRVRRIDPAGATHVLAQIRPQPSPVAALAGRFIHRS